MNILCRIIIISLALMGHAVSLMAQDSRSAFTVKGAMAEIYAFPFAGGMNACQFGEIDLDMDGTPDLLAFDRHGERLVPFINGGTPGQVDYSFAPQYVDELPEIFRWINLAVYNMDGKNDIFTYNPQFPGIIVYKNTSTDALRFELVVHPYLSSWYGSGYVNILVTYADYPGISDLDGDGDLDILTFWALGSFVEMHTNLSMENYGHADSLVFERTTSCWGYFAESEESNQLFLDTCFGRPAGDTDNRINDRHTGSTFLLADLDNNGTKDLLLGDVDYPQLIMLTNSGSPQEAVISSYTSDFPNAQKPVRIFSMPVAAMIDVNNDGARDLLASPFDPSPFVSQNHQSVWLYLNEGSNAAPEFVFNNNRFLQEQMIDLGSGAYPAFADINLDGLQDLIIGNWGYYRSSSYDTNMILSSEYASRMSIFLNTGTLDEPFFEFITDDFGFINEMNIKGAYPAFGDIDSDDDADMIVGRDDGTLLFYRNCSCLGNPEDFQLEFTNYQGIDVGEYSTPFVFDMDEDGLLDLIIGEKSGNLNYYKNTGDIYEPEFTFITDSLGRINVTDPGVSYEGYSTPYIFRAADGKIRLLSGSEQGVMYAFKNIEGNLEGAFSPDEELWKEVDSLEFDIRKGYRTSAAIADLNGDGYLELAVGNWSGGLELYSTELNPEVTMEIQDIPYASPSLTIFPNPARDYINIGSSCCGGGLVRIYSSHGILVAEREIRDDEIIRLGTGHLPNGIYICTLSAEGIITASRKFIIAD